MAAAAAAAALNTNDYYVQPVSGQLEIQSTLRILDGAKVCLQLERKGEREGAARQAKGKVNRAGGAGQGECLLNFGCDFYAALNSICKHQSGAKKKALRQSKQMRSTLPLLLLLQLWLLLCGNIR